MEHLDLSTFKQPYLNLRALRIILETLNCFRLSPSLIAENHQNQFIDEIIKILSDILILTMNCSSIISKIISDKIKMADNAIFKAKRKRTTFEEKDKEMLCLIFCL